MKSVKKTQLRSRVQIRDHRALQDEFAEYCGHRKHLWFRVNLGTVPEWACCYVIYVEGMLVYIGQTTNLLHRIRGHFAKGQLRGLEYNQISIKAKLGRKYGSWAMDEIRLISRLQPIWNRSTHSK